MPVFPGPHWSQCGKGFGSGNLLQCGSGPGLCRNNVRNIFTIVLPFFFENNFFSYYLFDLCKFYIPIEVLKYNDTGAKDIFVSWEMNNSAKSFHFFQFHGYRIRIQIITCQCNCRFGTGRTKLMPVHAVPVSDPDLEHRYIPTFSLNMPGGGGGMISHILFTGMFISTHN
jgi:hypothetical protein